jgi:hypothetical protein
MKMKQNITLLFAVFLFVLLAFAKERVVVLTDIENEPDDTQSVVRLLLYSDGLEIEGLVATTSTHMRTSVHSESLQALIAAYV